MSKKIYRQKIRDVWLKMPEFKDWLQRDSTDATRSYCSYCKINLIAKLRHLRAHAATRKHQKRAGGSLTQTDTKPSIDQEKQQWQPVKRVKQETIINCFPSEEVKCRICLLESIDDRMVALFDDNDQCKELVRKIEEIGGITLMPLEDMPSMLCSRCKDTLADAYKFREQIQASERTLANVETRDPIAHNDEQSSVIVKVDVDANDLFMATSNSSDSETETEIERPRPKQQVKQTKDTFSSSSSSGYGSKTNDVEVKVNCKLCDETFPDSAALKLHMRSHISEKPFQCEVCGKTFASSSELINHTRVHTGEKPFTCKYCPRTFSDRSASIRHLRTHTNERPFSCTTCGKAFAYSSVLKVHMLRHTGEKPFTCLPCKKSFTRNSDLIQHIGTLIHQQAEERTRHPKHETHFKSTNHVNLPQQSKDS